jgi:hypothetical protein
VSEDVEIDGSVFRVAQVLLLRVVSVRRCGNEWNGMKRDGG